MEKRQLIIIDSNSLVHRAYHALPSLTNKKGELVNAVYGFLLVFFRAIKEFQPDCIAACFDFPAPTFRHKQYKDYKAKRPPVPEELYRQIPKIKEVLEAFNVPVFEKEGFEADDIIGAIAHLSPETETIILSGDLDTLQLVDSHTKVYLLKRGVKEIVLYDELLVQKKYQGLTPAQLTDFKALKGDPSDNIIGAPGIGEKTAIELIQKFGSIENLYQEIEKGSKNAQSLRSRLKDILLKSKKQVFFSKELSQIKKDMPIDFDLAKCRWHEYDKEKAIQLLTTLEFHTLIKKIPQFKRSKVAHLLKFNF